MWTGVYGLEEASNEIKELEKKVKLRDKNIVEQTEKINKLEKEVCIFKYIYKFIKIYNLYHMNYWNKKDI